MSTMTAFRSREDETECCTDLHDLLCALEADSSLLMPARLRERLISLDDMDAAFGGFDFEDSAVCAYPRLHERAKALRMRFEAANSGLYQSLRSDIVCGGEPRGLLQWLGDSASGNEPESPLPGLGFDYRDELVSGVLQLLEPNEPGEPDGQLSPEMVFYQPTPVRHIVDLIAAASIAEEDVFVDLGSGLGHVPLLVSMMTGARSVGVEIQAAYVASARTCAESLGLSRVQFIARDAREADLSHGTIFYLYSPFRGSILADVLNALQTESMSRPIKICSLGPCTQRVSNEAWLKAKTLCDSGRISVFDSL